MKVTEPPTCKHCDQLMNKVELPPEAGYDCLYAYVCFNDECTYFVEGWRWMFEKYSVKSSYRNRINPKSGVASPLPVWSNNAMRDRIID